MSTNPLGTLGFHLDGRACRVGCEFCYLAGRAPSAERGLDADLIRAVIASAPARDIAVAVSEPARRWRKGLAAVIGAARARGLPVAVTTTAAVVASDPWVLDGISRLSISIDPAKDGADWKALERALAQVPADVEVIGLVSLVSPAFCATLADGLLARLVELPASDRSSTDTCSAGCTSTAT